MLVLPSPPARSNGKETASPSGARVGDEGAFSKGSSVERRKLVLDMDVGVDDAVAIVFLAQQPQVEIVALGSVHGNIDAPTAALNALRTLEVCGCAGVPVAVGASDPLVHPLVLATHVHGSDGMGDTNLP